MSRSSPLRTKRSETALVVSLEAARGRKALIAALARQSPFRRCKAGNVRSILEPGIGVATVAAEGRAFGPGLRVPVRDLAAYSLETTR